ncbi:META domain containing protein [Strigomonas culicis]|nr:META domain containing protein [Strigomonas culicis]|eukprot:EPY28729.1 META domain containing protein [Strigomonas culicis]
MLKNKSYSFMFERTVQLEDLHGEHAILSINGQKAKESMSIKFLPDGQGGMLVIANATNSIRGQCEIDGGYIRGDFASTSLVPTDEMAVAEAQVLDCFRSGCTIIRNRNGIQLKWANAYMQLCRIVHPGSIAGEYLLRSYNGEAAPKDEQSTIQFVPQEDGSLSVKIKVSSQLRGSARIENNVLRSDAPLKSNCVQATVEAQRIEEAYNTGFQYGLLATLLHKNGKTLMLRNSESELVYARVAQVEAAGAGPTYKGTYASKCFRTNGNGLLFRIVNEIENTWAFYNDTPDYRMFIRAVLGRRSQIQPLGDASMKKEDHKYVITATIEPHQTIMFLEGNVNGFQIQYKAEPA